jgi:hypothetical protein
MASGSGSDRGKGGRKGDKGANKRKDDIYDIPSDDPDSVHDILSRQHVQPINPSAPRPPPRIRPPPPPHAPPQQYFDLLVLPDNATDVAKRINNKAEVREIELRQGKELKGLEKGKANLEASLAYTRGTEPSQPCATCSNEKRPRGPFKRCIVVEDEFDGACTNCRYNDEGKVCTFHRLNANPTKSGKPRSASAKPFTPKPRTPTRYRKRAQKQIQDQKAGNKGKGKEVVAEEEGEDTKGGAEDEGDTDNSSDIGSGGDTDSEQDVPRNPWDLSYGPRKLRGG